MIVMMNLRSLSADSWAVTPGSTFWPSGQKYRIKFPTKALKAFHPVLPPSYGTISVICKSDYTDYQSWAPQCPGPLATRDDTFQASIPYMPSAARTCARCSITIFWNKQETHFRGYLCPWTSGPPYPTCFLQGWVEHTSLLVNVDELWVVQTSFVLFFISHLFSYSNLYKPPWEFYTFSACGFYC